MPTGGRAAVSFAESVALLRDRRFGVFWISSFLSNVGTWAQNVAEPWLLLSVGASSFMVGLDSFALNAPVWALTVVGGALADHGDRRRIIALFQSLQMLCPVLVVVLLVTGRVNPWVVILASLVIGVTDALSMPSFQSIVPSIVPRERIAQGLALNSTQFNLSRVVGPAVAGLLLASTGAMGCFALSAASYLPFIGVALWVLPRGRAGSEEAFPDRRALFAGIRESVRDPRLRHPLYTVLATSVLSAPLVTFTPVLVRDAFHGGASRFSAAISAFGLGGVVGALAMLAVPAGLDRRRLSSRFAMLYGAVLVLASVNRWFWGLPTLLVVAGVAMTVSNTSANAVLQSTADRSLLGRTVSLFMLAMRGGLALGGLLLGVTVGLVGIRTALFVNGALALVVHAGIGRRWLAPPRAAV